jgi:hypothetical protein
MRPFDGSLEELLVRISIFFVSSSIPSFFQRLIAVAEEAIDDQVGRQGRCRELTRRPDHPDPEAVGLVRVVRVAPAERASSMPRFIRVET